jgi:hypothetical protein
VIESLSFQRIRAYAGYLIRLKHIYSPRDHNLMLRVSVIASIVVNIRGNSVTSTPVKAAYDHSRGTNSRPFSRCNCSPKSGFISSSLHFFVSNSNDAHELGCTFTVVDLSVLSPSYTAYQHKSTYYRDLGNHSIRASVIAKLPSLGRRSKNNILPVNFC